MLRLLGFLQRCPLFPNPLVDFSRCLPLYDLGYVSVDIQGGAGGSVPHHRRESFHAYTVFQRRDYKGTPEIVEPDFRVLGLFRAPAQQLPDCRRASASSFGGWNNPAGIHPLPVSPHLLCRSERGSDGADSGIRFGLGYAPMFVLALFSHDVQRISLSLRIRLFTTLVLSSINIPAQIS